MTDSSAGSGYYPERGYSTYPMAEKARWDSQGSIAGSVHQSMASLYSPSTATSYILPIAQSVPDARKKTDDSMGIACCAVFINPLFGVIALLLADKSRAYFNRCSYIKARQYGQYARWTATSGIVGMVIVFVLIVSAVGNYYARFREY